MDKLRIWTDTALHLEKIRIALTLRVKAKEKQGIVEEDVKELLRRTRELEKYVDDGLKKLVKEHPAYPWFSRVKGCGAECVAKVLCFLDIKKAPYPSSFWKYAGFAPGFDKLQKGKKAPYNKILKSMCWRLLLSLNRARGCFYRKYREFKSQILEDLSKNNIKVKPSSSFKRKNGKLVIPDNERTMGWVDGKGKRKEIKLWMACLHIVWAEAIGMSIKKPYAIDIMGHKNYIDPWSMVDK